MRWVSWVPLPRADQHQMHQPPANGCHPATPCRLTLRLLAALLLLCRLLGRRCAALGITVLSIIQVDIRSRGRLGLLLGGCRLAVLLHRCRLLLLCRCSLSLACRLRRRRRWLLGALCLACVRRLCSRLGSRLSLHRGSRRLLWRGGGLLRRSCRLLRLLALCRRLCLRLLCLSGLLCLVWLLLLSLGRLRRLLLLLPCLLLFRALLAGGRVSCSSTFGALLRKVGQRVGVLLQTRWPQAEAPGQRRWQQRQRVAAAMAHQASSGLPAPPHLVLGDPCLQALHQLRLLAAHGQPALLALVLELHDLQVVHPLGGRHDGPAASLRRR